MSLSEFDLPKGREMPKTVAVLKDGIAQNYRLLARQRNWPLTVFKTDQRLKVFEYLNEHSDGVELFWVDSGGCGYTTNPKHIPTEIMDDYTYVKAAREFTPEAHRVVMMCCDQEWLRIYQKMEAGGFADAVERYPGSFGYLTRMIEGYDRAIKNRQNRQAVTKLVIAATALGVLNPT